MDEDDFKDSSREPSFDYLIPKSFVTAERKIKNRALNALRKIEESIESLNIHEPTVSSTEMLNRYAKILNDIMFIIKDVDIDNKK